MLLRFFKKNCNYDINKITYYNYNKKSHYINIYTKYLKNKRQYWLSLSVINASDKKIMFKKVPFINYLIQF